MEERLSREQRMIEATASAAGAAASYCWVSEDGGTEIALNFDVVDRLGFDVMRGFGALPKRGAEVGGILLGRAAGGTRIEVEDFLLVPCTHARGPSFLLTDDDLQQFDQILAKAGRSSLRVVGLFRSNTREALELTAEDLVVFGARLGEESGVVLLIKPHATRPPEAAFFLRRDGQLSATPSGVTFPFRRKDLGGGRAQKRQRSEEGVLDLTQPAAAVQADLAENGAATTPAPDYEAPSLGGLVRDLPQAEPAPRTAPEPKTRSTWVWLPLSFVFLLLGLVLGFQIALSFRPPKPVAAAPAADPYSLGLSVSEFNSSLHLRWNADSPAVKGASKALLHIQDGDNMKTVSLGRDDLVRGGVLYRYSSGAVAFRLEVFPQERTSVSESVDIRMLEPAGGSEAKK